MLKDVHVTLGDDVVARLDNLSRKLALSRNSLVREAIADFVARKEREAMADEMAEYARGMADESGRFVAETEISVERMLRECTEW